MEADGNEVRADISETAKETVSLNADTVSVTPDIQGKYLKISNL